MIPGAEGTYVKIPMPHGIHVMPNIGRMISEIFFSSRPNDYMEKIMDAADVMIDAFNPMGDGTAMDMFTPAVQTYEKKEYRAAVREGLRIMNMRQMP